MAETRKRTTRRTTGSKRYKVLNPRGIEKGVRILKGSDGAEYREGDTVSADQIPESALQPWLDRGQIEKA
tara:strand:- start:2256 stop:2465 length:210 start_codon:yes stop_codon:yes gene_type:complete